MITLDDIALPLPTPDIKAAIERDLGLDRLALLFNRSWPGFGTVGIALPTRYRAWPPQPLRLNRFYWPTGASRHAFGMFLAGVEHLNAMHADLFGASGTETNTTSLVMTSEDQDGAIIETLTARGLTVLPPIPLYRVLNSDSSSDHGMYLMVVVDQRFFWWDHALPDLGITETAGKTWANVFSSIATALNITITTDTINTKYLNPSRALNLTYEAIPPLLDACCANVGHRLVVDPATGNVNTQAFSTALTAYQSDAQGQAGQARTVRAGGPRFLGSY